MTLSTSDIINIISIIATFTISCVSIVIAVVTLLQNAKALEEAERPYIAVYGQSTYVRISQFYIVIKNFGKSGATISKLSSDIDLKKYSFSTKRKPFENIENTFLAPNQSMYIPLNQSEIDFENIKFEIEYKTPRKTYRDTYNVNYDVTNSFTYLRACGEGNELKQISYALQEIVEKNL